MAADERVLELIPNGDVVLILRTTTAPPVQEPHVEWLADQPANAGNALRQPKYIILLSSQRLAAASTVFADMLKGDRGESVHCPRPCYNIELLGYDIRALLAFVSVIHGRAPPLPSIDFGMLARLAVLTLHFAAYKLMEPWAKRWRSDLTVGIPTRFCRDVVLWLLVSGVFSFTDDWTIAVRVATKTAAGPLDTMGIFIPRHVIDKINKHRQIFIKQVNSELYKLWVSFTIDDHGCTFACKAMLLGTIDQLQTSLGLNKAQCKRPYLGFVIDDIARAIRSCESPTWTEHGRLQSRTYHECYISPYFGEMMDRLERSWESYHVSWSLEE